MTTVYYSEEYGKIVDVLKSFDPSISIKVYEKESGVPIGSGNVIYIKIDSINTEPLSTTLDLFKITIKASIEAIIDNIKKLNEFKDYIIKKMKNHSDSEEIFIPESIEQFILNTGNYLTINFVFYYIKRVD